METRTCKVCGKELKKTQKSFCSRACQNEGFKIKIAYPKVCAWCGKEFTAYKPKTQYCSVSCRNLLYRKMEKEQKEVEASKPKVDLINEINAEAVKHGMSYGQWKAQEFMKSIAKVQI